ncbi:hypothetical protein HD806DRAFT_465677 [Xylariaceae sp. AK1471]|nr:hypothetical protein HD806DRAFT_465677 [Xylariaceae sp. AK1471]
MHLPYVEQPYRAPPGFRVRNAELTDVGSITDIWYAAFNPSHKLFDYATPNDATTRKWFEQLWTIGIKAGPGVIKTFVLEDLSRGNKLVAFSRWHVPQADGNQDIPMPPFPTHWDPYITTTLWGGMAQNRARVMGQKPHWMGEFIAIDHAYQNKRLAVIFADWAIRQADSAGLEIYADASEKGLPIWKHYGFEERGPPIQILGRPGQFETYEVTAIVRPAKTRGIEKL